MYPLARQTASLSQSIWPAVNPSTAGIVLQEANNTDLRRLYNTTTILGTIILLPCASKVFEHSYGRQFRPIPEATARLQMTQFRFLPSFTFLCRLSGSPKANTSGLELTSANVHLFEELDEGLPSFDAAVKLSKSRKKAAQLDAEVQDTTVGINEMLI
ncbi:hypothetical protein B0H10DRAFT_1941879 [Mycena sp. CBHHK59/15]|nr:hypothetical protein B0H10DRAFT_1941879 [Mycena sp. CBHHK59/15]